MKITATFDSLEEFQAFIGRGVKMTKAEPKKQAEPEVVGATPEEMKAIEAEEKAEEAEKPKKEKAKKEPEPDFDAIRVECRKVLAELNQVTGKNTASEIIKTHGCKKLSEVEDMFLPALLEEAKEALQDAK
jgi:hypothetical protein